MSRAHRRRGGSAIELALTLPVFLACSVGAFDLARFLFDDAALALALDEACRVTALGDPAAALEPVLAAELDRAFGSYGLAGCPECVVTAAVSGASPGRRLACGVSRPVVPIASIVLGDTTLEASTSVRLERQR